VQWWDGLSPGLSGTRGRAGLMLDDSLTNVATGTTIGSRSQRQHGRWY